MGFCGRQEGACRIRKLRHGRRHTCEPRLPAAAADCLWLAELHICGLEKDALAGMAGEYFRRQESLGRTGGSGSRPGRPAISASHYRD